MLARAATAAAFAVPGTGDAFDRIVEDPAGKPLPAAYAIGTWELTVPRPVQAQSACVKLELTQTGSDGRFKLPDHSGRILGRIIGTEHLNVYYYKAGYYWNKSAASEGHRVVMVLDSRGMAERLRELSELTGHADCGSDEESTRNRITLYKAIYAELSAAATSADVRLAAVRTLFEVERLELGEATAWTNLARREAEIKRP